MAEPTASPALPSTADTTPYVPVSWMAVAAISVAGAFAVTLVALGAIAFTSKKPLLEAWLLGLPAVTIVLSFAARRVIRNSEGTRTGENLAVYAWWTAVVGGLCYVAYLFAIDFAIRRDARREVEKWMGFVAKGTEDDLDAAFRLTIAPGKRQVDRFLLRSQLRDELLVFRNCDLLKLAQRNKDTFEFAPGAVTWIYKSGTVECVVFGTVTCPEGTFPVVIPIKGTEGVTGAEGGGGRQWAITPPQGGGFVDQNRATRTDYGWLVSLMEGDGGNFGRAFLAHQAGGPSSHIFAYRAFVAPGGDTAGWSGVALDPLLHLAFAGPARVAFGDAGYAEYLNNQFYKLPGGAEPSADQKSRFLASWNALGLRQAGDRLKGPGGDAIDREVILTVTESAIEVRVPVEIPVVGTGRVEAARGRLVVVCTDPAVMAEFQQLREKADPAHGTSNLPAGLDSIRRKATWRVLRVESEMVPVNIASSMPGAPDGMGPPGMGPPGM